MSGFTIDPHILEVAGDYKELHDNTFVDSVPYSNPNEKVFAATKELLETTKDETVKMQLVSTWFKCMVDGGIRILYPESVNQIRFYYTHFAADYWRKILIIATIFLLIGPFVTQPVCYVSSSSFANEGLLFFSIVYVSFLFLHILDFFMLCKSSPINEVFNFASTAPHDFNIQWSIMHFIATVIIIIDLFVYFSDPYNPRIMRCLFPVIYIAKRINLKSLLGGLYMSILQTTKVYRLLILILIFFSILGYVLFGEKDQEFSNGTHWSTISYSFLTCLHCFSSKPSVLYRIKALFDAGDNVSVINFFVVLILFTDVLFTAVIIATGKKFYSDFKSVYLRTLLKYRKILLDSIFNLYADKNGLVSLDSWVRFTAVDLSYSSYHVYNTKFATTLFQLEDTEHKGYVDKKSFFGLCGILSTIPYNNAVKSSYEKATGSNKIKILTVLNATNNSSVGIELHDLASENTKKNEEAEIDDERTIISEMSKLRLNSISKKEQETSVSRLSELSATYMNRPSSLWYRLYKVCKVYTMYYSLIIMGYRVQYSGSICYITEIKFDFVPWSICSAIMHIVLVVQLCFVSRAGNNRGWEIGGYFLLFYFFLDNFIQYMASSVTLFTSIKDLVINTTTFLAKIVLSSSAVGSTRFETALTIVILVQSIRSMKLIKFFKGAYLIKAISPVILQVLEILFLIIYFFSIIGHSLFCSVRYIDVPQNTDDDSSAYLNYEEILNFGSNLQSVYTMALVAVIGNWSMVMNYASRGLSHGQTTIYYPHLYFYGFRLLMFFVAIPLLLSFIIQNFVQQLNKKQKSSKESKIKYKVTPKTFFRTTLIKSWSLDTRETMSPPPASSEVKSFEVLLGELITKYKLLQDCRSKVTASGGTSSYSEGSQPFTKRIYEIYDPEIMAQVSYWMDLYKSGVHTVGVNSEADPLIAEVQGVFSSDKYPEIAYCWLNDAGTAPSRRISIPKSERDFFVYKFSRSDLLHSLCTVLIMIQIILVLLSGSEDCGRSQLDIETNIRLTIVDFMFIWIHLLESGSNAYLTLTGSLKSAVNWHCFRFFSCFLILIDCIQYLAVQDSVRFSRCLFVVLIVSRLLDLKHYVHSLVVAMKKSRQLYTLFVFFLLVLSMEGFLLFQRFKLDPGESRFSNFGMSIASVLHSFTSSPFGLLILKPYFKLSPVSSLFWLTITYALEILGINLLVAVGANQYQKSFDHQVERRLKQQRRGVTSAWFMLCTADSESGTRRLTKASWLKLVAIANNSSLFNDLTHLLQYMAFGPVNIAAMFGVSSENCPLRARLHSRMMHGSILFDYIDNDNKGYIDSVENFFKLVALYLNNVNCVRVLHVESDISKSDHNTSATTSSNSQHFNQFVPPQQSSKLLHLSEGVLESDWKRNTIIHYRLFLPRVKSYVSSVFYSYFPSWTEKISQVCRYIVSCHVRLRLRRDTSGESVVNPIVQKDTSISDRSHSPSPQSVYGEAINIGFFNVINIVMHIVLASQLVNSIIAFNHQAYSEIFFGFNAYFCVSMVMKMVAMGGENLYWMYYVHRFDFYINVYTILAYIVQSNMRGHRDALFSVITLLQILRFRKIFWIESTFYRLSKVSWSILKIFLLLFLIIYFFGVIAHDTFCTVMNEVQNLSVRDRPSGINDDTQSYFNFREVLSFSTYFVSLFSLFQVSILGTWSSIMDSAALVAPSQSYSFFYTFRLIMTLSIFPFLISIIIKVVRTLEDENNDKILIEKYADTLFYELSHVVPQYHFYELSHVVPQTSINRISKRLVKKNSTKTIDTISVAKQDTAVDTLSHKCYEILCLLFNPSIPTSSHLTVNPNPLIIDLGIIGGTSNHDDDDDGCICKTLHYKLRSFYNSSLDNDEFYLKYVQEVLCNNTSSDDNTYYNASLFMELKSRIDLTIATISAELDYYNTVEGSRHQG